MQTNSPRQGISRVLFGVTSSSLRRHFDVYKIRFTPSFLRRHFEFTSIAFELITIPQGKRETRFAAQGKKGNSTREQGKENSPTAKFYRNSLGNKTARTHKRNETISQLNPHPLPSPAPIYT